MMTPLYPPLVPGLTDVPDGSKAGRTLYQLVTLQRRKPELFPPPFGDVIKGFRSLFTPAEPPPEPLYTQLSPPTGRSLGRY